MVHEPEVRVSSRQVLLPPRDRRAHDVHTHVGTFRAQDVDQRDGVAADPATELEYIESGAQVARVVDVADVQIGNRLEGIGTAAREQAQVDRDVETAEMEG